MSQELAHFARVEMVDETPDPRLSKTSEALHKVEPLSNGVVWVIINALFGRSLAEHVAQKGGVSGFLVGHEFNERQIFGIETGFEEFSF